MYRPLPDGLTIKNSPIEGLGLFATIEIKANSFIGITHIRDEQFENKYIRTPLGGFYNHSKNPNIIKLGTDTLPEFKFGKTINSNLISSINKKNQKKSNFLFLVSLKDINPGQELVAEYTFYQF